MDILYEGLSKEDQYDAMVQKSVRKMHKFYFNFIVITSKEAFIKIWVEYLKNMICTMEYTQKFFRVTNCRIVADMIKNMSDQFNNDLLKFETRLVKFRMKLSVYVKNQTLIGIDLNMPADRKMILDDIMPNIEGIHLKIHEMKTTTVQREENLNQFGKFLDTH